MTVSQEIVPDFNPTPEPVGTGTESLGAPVPSRWALGSRDPAPAATPSSAMSPAISDSTPRSFKPWKPTISSGWVRQYSSAVTSAVMPVS